MDKALKGFRNVKNAMMNYSEIEKKVKMATSNEPWGASQELLQLICDSTFEDKQECRVVMDLIWKRLADTTKWRHIYKTLVLLEYICVNGSENALVYMQSKLFEIDGLTKFEFIDEDGHDYGLNIRNKAKEISLLLRDKTQLDKSRMHQQQQQLQVQPSVDDTDYLSKSPVLTRNRAVFPIQSSSPLQSRSSPSIHGANNSIHGSLSGELNHFGQSSLPATPRIDSSVASSPIKLTIRNDTFEELSSLDWTPTVSSFPSEPFPIVSSDAKPSSLSINGSIPKTISNSAPAVDDDFNPRAPISSAPTTTTTTSTLSSFSTSSFPLSSTSNSSVDILDNNSHNNNFIASSVATSLGLSAADHTTSSGSFRADSPLFSQEKDSETQYKEFRQRMLGHGWHDLRVYPRTEFPTTLLWILTKSLCNGQITYRHITPNLSLRSINLEKERKYILQWLYNNGTKQKEIFDLVIKDALTSFPTEKTEQVSFLKYITMLARNGQQSVYEILSATYKYNFGLVIFKEGKALSGLQLERMIVPKTAAKIVYCVSIGDQYEILQPREEYDSVNPNIFRQAPPSIRMYLLRAFEAQYANVKQTPSPKSPISSFTALQIGENNKNETSQGIDTTKSAASLPQLQRESHLQSMSSSSNDTNPFGQRPPPSATASPTPATNPFIDLL